MKIFSMKPGHDGNVALLEDGRLSWQMEAEKDSFPRYEVITPDLFLSAAALMDEIPDAVAVSGWVKGWHSVSPEVNGGYFGYEESRGKLQDIRFMGKDVKLFTSTHERSHLFCSYGLSPFPQGQPCYALVWEGNLGCFYEIGADLGIERLSWPLVDPGNKYAQLFAIADPAFPVFKGHFDFSNAGKLMALAAFSQRKPLGEGGRKLIDAVLAADGLVKNLSKDAFGWSEYYNIGVKSEAFKELAGCFSDRIFEIFHEYAKTHLNRGWPLLISGGCGLNCEWNSRWLESGLFEDVFVPPCTNDTGAALGTGIEAQYRLTGSAKLKEWSVYAGKSFEEDEDVDGSEFVFSPLDHAQVASFLNAGNVIAWVQGRYEMGPRALGNRSILAEPFRSETRDRLNRIKQREDYRPIACVCLESEAREHFDLARPSPHMLFFHRVRNDALRAVTHVDRSSRVQTVSPEENPKIAALLEAFKAQTGVGVLCNTSLNFKGRGFINRTSDLVKYVLEAGLDGFVVGNAFYRRRGRAN
jgi:predicted NodU family carbamoyl transferase